MQPAPRLLALFVLLLSACGDPAASSSESDGGEVDGSADAGAPESPPDAAFVDPCERDHRYADERCDLDCANVDLDCQIGIVGHRGSAFRKTENTLPSYQRAMEEGANALEIDVNLTSDDQVVIWHDHNPDASDALAREAGLEGLPWRPWVPDLGDSWRRTVDTLTLEELRGHYGYAFTSTGVKDDTAEIPTFAEFVAWSASAAHLQEVFVDVKEDDESHARSLALQMEDATAGSRYQLFLMSPREAIVVAMRDALEQERPAHRARLIFDFEKAGALAGARKLGLDTLSTGKTVLRSLDDFLAELEDIAVHRDEPPRLDPVVVWTFDDDADLVAVLGAGADAVLSNRPADLGRQVFRGYDDHRRLAEAALACFDGHGGETAKVLCADGAALALFAPLREEQVYDWVCSDSSQATNEMRDLFGCGLLLDAEVEFRGDPQTAAEVAVWYEPPASAGAEAIVVVGDVAEY